MSAITVRVHDSIYGHLKNVAQNDGMSVNPFFVTAVELDPRGQPLTFVVDG